MSDIDTNKNEIKICTKLTEIYSKENIDKSIESQFEDLHSKYNYLFKCDPEAIIRVPYSITLFGDTVTQLFSNKVIANLSNELIILFNKNNSNELNIKYFDHVHETKTSISEFTNLSFKDKDLNLNDFAIVSYLSALKQLKTNNNFGSNILIMLNNPNKEETDCYISVFIAIFLSCIYVNDKESIVKKKITKTNLYEMIVLSLTEICEQNSLSNKININYYTPDIYFKIFLKKNNLGFNQGNLFFQQNINIDNKPVSLLVFDSLSPEPIKYYSSSKYWNKRKVEVRLAMALIIKRYKENMTNDDIIKNAGNFEEFLKIFDNNFESILKAVDIYLKKDIYTLSEIKNELGFNIDKLLKDIGNYQGALLTKEFKLYDRILFIIKECQLVSLLYYKTKINDKINWKQTIIDSAKLLRENYYCYSDEMLKIEAELKVSFNNSDIPIKCISNGWHGKMVIVGNKEIIGKYEEFLFNKFEKLTENQGDGLANAWITDDINKYCFISDIEEGLAVLDPKYEDFMLDYVKQKNNVVASNVGENK